MAGRSEQPRATLSIDVDDLLIANLDFADEPIPPGYSTCIAAEVAKTLDVLSACHARATFFVNAQYAASLGTLLGDTVAEGHVLASHGFDHRNVQSRSLSGFRDDLRRSLEVLRRHQAAVVGYRAPCFSMPYDEPHFEVLRAEGIRYVSTGVGVARSNAPTGSEIVAVAPDLLHVPISIRVWAGPLKYAVGYGSAARLLPEPLAVRMVRREIERRRRFHFYCHPFEIAGVDRACVRHIRARSRRLATWTFALRCRGREQLFRSILGCARFEPIESHLARLPGATSESREEQTPLPSRV